MTPQEYQNYVRRKQKKSPLGKDMALAFLIGGLICAAGQGILNGWLAAGLREEDAAAATSISLVFLSALLTALNLYNKLARFGGAGTLVPITGFANAVVSPAIDFRAEGIVTGTAAKMFVIAGPVIVFGTAASALSGLILWLVGYKGEAFLPEGISLRSAPRLAVGQPRALTPRKVFLRRVRRKKRFDLIRGAAAPRTL